MRFLTLRVCMSGTMCVLPISGPDTWWLGAVMAVDRQCVGSRRPCNRRSRYPRVGPVLSTVATFLPPSKPLPPYQGGGACTAGRCFYRPSRPHAHAPPGEPGPPAAPPSRPRRPAPPGRCEPPPPSAPRCHLVHPGTTSPSPPARRPREQRHGKDPAASASQHRHNRRRRQGQKWWQWEGQWAGARGCAREREVRWGKGAGVQGSGR
jgi:hypothetical protein